MANVTIPRMTKPWKVVAAAMAVFGFVYGYVGTAGQLCGSLASCLQDVVDRGPAGFAPASLIPGAIGSVIFAAVVYVLFLIISGIRKAFHTQPSLPDGLGPSTRPTLAVRKGPKPWPRPTPLLVAMGVALAWAILSVGPARLISDLGELIPRDTVTAAFCVDGRLQLGDQCPIAPVDPAGPIAVADPPDFSPPEIGPADLTKPQCVGYGFGVRPEPDGKCHERSGGTVEPLMDDLLDGGRSGLLAFLAVGAALVLWPRLRAASQPPG